MNRYEKGLEIIREHLGKEAADEYIEKIKEVAPFFAKVNVEFPFGDLYTHECTLAPSTRELATIAALTVLGYAHLELKLHIKAALNCGATKEEIVEVITQMIAYCGFPAATNAILLAREIFNSPDDK